MLIYLNRAFLKGKLAKAPTTWIYQNLPLKAYKVIFFGKEETGKKIEHQVGTEQNLQQP